MRGDRPVGGGGGRISRRRALAAVTWGVAALSGCTLHRAAVHASSTTVLLGLGPPVPPAAIAAAVKTQFSHDNPGFALRYPADHDPNVHWWLEQDIPSMATVDLGPDLTALNFDRAVLPQAVWSAASPSGRLTDMPTALAVTAVGYSPAALLAAGAKVPAPDWSWDDFVLVCAQVDAALRAGRLDKLGIQSVLPYLAGDPRQADYPACFYYSPLWMAVIQGFGGEIVADGRAAVASASAAAGMTALVDLVRRFGNMPTAPRPDLFKAVPDGVALQFTRLPENPEVTSVGSGATYARFPKLPARAYVPADVNCRGLHDRPDPLSKITPTVVVPQRVTEGAARFFMWRYEYAQQDLFADVGVIPLTNAQGVQERFFRKTYGMDIAPRDLLFPNTAIPAGAVTLSWLDALANAVDDPAQVPGLLDDLAHNIDVALAKQRLLATGGGPGPGATEASG